MRPALNLEGARRRSCNSTARAHSEVLHFSNVSGRNGPSRPVNAFPDGNCIFLSPANIDTENLDPLENNRLGAASYLDAC